MLDFEPPPALAELTCDLVEGYAEERPLAVPAKRQTHRVGWARVRSAACEPCFPSGTWSAADTIVMAGVLLAVSLIFFPAIAGSRYRAQITACGDNLRNLGIALVGYSEQHQGFFPSIPVSGNRSVAGIYAVLLAEAERLEDPRMVLCPGSRRGTQRADFRIPTPAELDQARGVKLLALQQEHGGRLRVLAGNLQQRVLPAAAKSAAGELRPVGRRPQPAPAGSAERQPLGTRPECHVRGFARRVSLDPSI